MIDENLITTKQTISSVVSPQKPTKSSIDNEVYENKLRPKSLKEYIGQTEVKKNLQIFIQASKQRKETLEHLLFYGPPGLGKTTLAMLLAEEMKTNLRITSGPALEKPGDLAAILSNLQENDFLFIDEIHRLRTPVEEILYTAMEDFAIDLVIGKGPSARNMRLNIPKFTLVGATTRVSLLGAPLRDRFGHIEKLRYYELEEISQILERSSNILQIKIDSDAQKLLAKSCRRTPRIANRLIRRMRDFAEILHEGIITKNVVLQSLQSLSVDEKGLDYSDQIYLEFLCEKFKGGPVGLSTIAAAIGEDSQTLEEVIEPYLIQEGLLERTSRGRRITEIGILHWNKKIKKNC